MLSAIPVLVYCLMLLSVEVRLHLLLDSFIFFTDVVSICVYKICFAKSSNQEKY